MNGEWSSWSSWSVCSETCGAGRTKSRTRSCNNPSPANGGAFCRGYAFETVLCELVYCPINGSWSDWGNWLPCSATCGTGLRSRERECNNPSPQHGGQYCTGQTTESEICVKPNCAVDGRWGEWSSYSGCSVTCGEGTQTRTRYCNSPSPSNGGSECEGNASEESVCDVSQPCPENGKWGLWSPWSSCSATCNEGVISRIRQCNDPPPSNGGSQCIGDATEKVSCFTVNCPVPAQWGPWSPWSLCAVSCGESVVQRLRFCNDPPPSQGEDFCQGNSSENKACSVPIRCPVDGGVGPWSPWSVCSVTCNTGVRSRLRLCNNPSPMYNGRACIDALNQTVSCYINCTGKLNKCKEMQKCCLLLW